MGAVAAIAFFWSSVPNPTIPRKFSDLEAPIYRAPLWLAFGFGFG
jgi:hypothetical protein